MRTRLLPAVAVLGLAALVGAAVLAAAGVGSTGGGDRPAAAPPRPVTRDGVPLGGPVGRYVALGDSYTAGPLIRWVHSDPPGCLRSSRNYPAVLAQWLGARELVDASCSGADTGDIDGPQESFGRPVPPQLDAVTADTDLVTLGIGGNDFGLFSALVSGDRPTGIGATLDRTGRHVAGVVTAVHEQAPDAVVAVVGYPRIVPDHGTCAAVPFGSADNRYLDRVERALNRRLRLAAVGADAVYVDTYGPSRGHGACAGRHAWVNGVDTIALRALAFHPFETGMMATARALQLALRGALPSPAVQQRAVTTLATRPADVLSRPGQRLVASLLGG